MLRCALFAAVLSLSAFGQALTITTPPSLPSGVVGTAYSQTFAATGGAPGYTWAVTAGALPAGLSFSAAGTLAGTPVTAGISNFTVRVTDNAQTSVSQNFTVTIAAAGTGALAITTPSALPAGAVGVAYSQTLSATGGTPPYNWTLGGGSLPAGLTISTAGTVTGTPTAAGTATFTATVFDMTLTNVSQTFTLNISSGGTVTLAIVTASPLPAGVINVAYTQALAATGGTAPYTWAVASGTLPAGLTLSSGGTFSGTPTALGTSTFTVRVADSTLSTASQVFSLTVNATGTSGLTIVTASQLPPGVVGAAYSQTLAATGGSAPYTWALNSGSLPAGLTLSSSGTLAGTPTTVGTSTFTVRVADSTLSIASQVFNLTVNATGSSGLTITTPTPLPSGVVGVAYTQALAATGGTPPYTWALASGSLPAGLTLSSAGTLSGTPGAVGTATFTVRVGDSTLTVASQAFTMTVNATGTSGLSIVTTSPLPTGSVGTAYSQALVAAGGTAPYTWSLLSGTLPPGLSLSTAGSITGTPTTTGVSSFMIGVADNASHSANQSFTMTVVAAGQAGNGSLPHFVYGGGFVMGFYVVNNSSQPASFTINFYDDSGRPVALPFTGLSTSTTLTDTITGNGSKYYEAGTFNAPIVAGAGVVSSNSSITIQGLIRRHGGDNSYYEAAVGVTTGYSEFVVPFDATIFPATGDPTYTGFAVANLDPVNAASIACTARDPVGNVIPGAVSVPLLNPLGHWAANVFPALTGLRGTLDCVSNTRVGAIALRAIGTNAISSLPVVQIR